MIDVSYVIKLMETFLFVETISMFSIFVIGHHQFNVNENLISF